MRLMKPGLRAWIFVLFGIVAIGGLVILNGFFQKQQNKIESTIDALTDIKELGSMAFLTPVDSIQARKLINRHQQSLGFVKITLTQTRLYSALILLGIILASSTIFVFFVLRLSRPLAELREATEQIRRGNFSVHLPETGIYEMRALKNSFNLMSYELEAVQKRLLVAEKEMIWKDLSRILAHEIKNPLTPIQLAIQRLEERLGTNPEGIKEILPPAIAIIQQEIENLRLLAQDFSNFAKISQPQKESFDPATAIREICKSYEADYKLVCNLPDGFLISFDRTHFYQVITNIIQNAIDASCHDAPIELSISKDRSFIIISIRDQGCGIENESIHRIFEPYYTNKTKGTGLGLALVKKLCDTNRAVIRVKSKPGEGSTFTLIIEEVKA